MSQVIPLRLKMSNAFLIKGDKLAIIDTGSPNEMPAIVSAIENIGAEIQDLSLIIHTHAHFVHCGCTVDLKNATGASTVIHHSDLESITKGINSTLIPINWFGKILMPFLKKQYKPIQPDIIIEDELDLHPYGIDAKAISTPGHTPGSISVLMDSGEAIIGDLFGGGKLLGLFQPGRPRYHHWYSDANSAKTSIERILERSPSQIFVGHGGPLDGKAAAMFFSKSL